MLTDLTESVFIEKLHFEVLPIPSEINGLKHRAGSDRKWGLGTSNTNIMKNKQHLQTVSTYLYFMECVLGILTGF